MNHRERMEACIAGKETDRPPVALWRHFPVDDMGAETLAEAHLAFQRQFDFDLLKVTPSSGYYLYDWGVEDEWQGDTEGTRAYTKRVIHSAGDWEGLRLHDPNQGHLGAMLKALETIKKELGPETPVIMTIFNPLSNAKKLVGDEMLLAHLRQEADGLKKGLELLAQDTVNFVEALKDTGIDGLFYAVQHAQASLLTVEEYAEFGRPYDLPILGAASDFWLNVLHLHGDGVYFDAFTDYPVQVINWHDLETEPDLATAKTKFPGVVCGGLRQWDTVVLGTPEKVREEARAAIQATEGERFILGTGCVAPITAPYGNLMAARRSVE